MRVVSLVPSWTETLIEAGCQVVGRTRYCIHPESKVAAIPAVGGTKDWDWPQIQALKPDLLVLDQEENPKFMSEQTEIPYVATHVEGVRDVPNELEKLQSAVGGMGFESMISAWKDVLASESLTWDGRSDFPGLIEWGVKPSQSIKRIEYVIWKRPWMGVARNTFIGSVLDQVGFSGLLPLHAKKYPELNLENQSDKESTLLLFSSEPFPFLTIAKSLGQLGYPYAIVNGESFSWFGIRALRFLQSVKQRRK